MAPAALRRREAARLAGRSRSRAARSACCCSRSSIVAGFAGPPDPLSNFAPVFVLIVVLGRDGVRERALRRRLPRLQPVARGRPRRWCCKRARRAYPERLGVWPAAAALLIFTWIELASGWGEHPPASRPPPLVYSLLTWAAMAVYGVETLDPPRRGLQRLLQPALAALDLREARPRGRACGRCWAGCRRSSAAPGTVALHRGDDRHGHVRRAQPGRAVAASLSGGADGVLRRHDRPAARRRAGRRLLPARDAGRPHRRRRPRRARRSARAFVHSLVPIAAVYVAAHYLTFLSSRARRSATPRPTRSARAGTCSAGPAPGSTTACCRQNAAWYLQVALRRRSGTSRRWCWRTTARSSLYGQARLAVRSQYWMLGIMIGFTTLALWLLAQAGRHEARAALVALALALAPAAAATRPTAGRAREGAARTRLVDFSKKPPLRQHARHRPGDQRLPADDQPRLLADRARTAARSRRSRAPITDGGKTATVGTFLEIRSHRPGPAARQRPSRQARHAAELPRPAALRRRRQDLDARSRGSATPTCTRSSCATTSSTRSTPSCRRC